MSRLRPLVYFVGVALCMLVAAAPAAARVPQGFVGMVVGPPLFPDSAPNANLNNQFGLMVSSGVQTIRVAVDWGTMQPYKRWSDVPSADRAQFQADGVDQIPTRFGPLDAFVGSSAQHGITVLPTVLGAPSWDGKLHKYANTIIPSRMSFYGDFLKVLVLRYGPHGSFWHNRPRKVPIRMWQVWNEPNEFSFWPIQPFARSYVSLLRVAHAAIKSADPSAKVVMAGMSNYSWKYLADVYKVRGARQLFDVAGVHPYTAQPAGVITIVGYIRQVMNANGDAKKPIDVDEMGWPSSVGQTSHLYGFETTEAGQALNIAAVLPLLADARRRLGILSFYYYAWAGIEYPNANTFNFSGLERFSSGRFVKKPGFYAFGRAALGIEGCRRKGLVATSCLG